MTGVVMDTGEDKLTPYKVVQFFQSCLNQAGNPIEFTTPGSAPAQRAHAKKLIAACKCDRREIKAVIRAYCADPWWVEKQPDLAQVVKQLNRLQVKAQQEASSSHGYARSWREL